MPHFEKNHRRRNAERICEEVVKIMDNKDIVTAFFIEGYVKKNYDYIMQYVSEEYYDHSPANARSNKDVVGVLKIVSEQFSELKVEVADIFAENNKVAIRVLFQGIHTGICMGVPATGKKICFEALEYFRVDNGKIVESWGYWPDKEIERQLLA